MMNPAMLTLLRESRGISGAELAKRADIPQPTISKLEHGLATIDNERLARIAAALDYPVEAFAWTDPIYGFGSAAFFHRKQQTLPQTSLRRIQAEVNLARIRLERLLRNVEIDTESAVPSIEPEQLGGASEVARAVRALWRIPMGPVTQMTALLERAGVIVVRANLESPKISAISLDAVGPYPPVIILNEGLAADRERFTLCHELGHFVMHTTLNSSDEAEAEADAFAAEFLMPAAEIRSQLRGITLAKAAQLKMVWRVSMAALIRRAKDLKVIDDSRYKSLYVSISQKGWRKAEPVPIERERLTLVPSLIDVHLREHEFHPGELAKVVGLSEAEFRSRYEVRVDGPGPARLLRATK